MATTEERMQILKMIEEGTISAVEGAELLKALAEGSASGSDSAESSRTSQPRWFRVRVTDVESGRNKVHLNIPMGLVNVGMRMGARFVPEIQNEKYATMIREAQSGKQGKVFEAVDDNGTERIEIFVE